MLAQVVTVLVTAVLSSVLTAWLLLWVFDRRIRPDLEASVESQLRAALRELEEIVRDRVRQGVLDGVAAIPSREVLVDTGRTMTDTAAEIVKGGISAFLGGSELGIDPEPRRTAEDTAADEEPEVE